MYRLIRHEKPRFSWSKLHNFYSKFNSSSDLVGHLGTSDDNFIERVCVYLVAFTRVTYPVEGSKTNLLWN